MGCDSISRIHLKRILTSIVAASIGGLLTTQPGLAQSSVEGGIADLAAQIVERSASADKTTIAISAFPHVDNTCSELSNYLADELVLSLFSVPGNSLSIVERSQLDRIFSEIELSMSGAVDANTTQELGRIAGVDTLLVGSITDMGDELRVNARLLDTETAQVFSAAAVNLPRTNTVESLYERESSTGCTMTPAGRSSSTGTAPSGQSSSGSSGLTFSAGELDTFDQLRGHWIGVLDCQSATHQIWLGLNNVMSNGLTGVFRGSWEYSWDGRFDMSDTHYLGSASLVLVPTRGEDGPQFRLSVHQDDYRATYDVTLFGTDTLYGKPRGENCTEVNLGRLQSGE